MITQLSEVKRKANSKHMIKDKKHSKVFKSEVEGLDEDDYIDEK